MNKAVAKKKKNISRGLYGGLIVAILVLVVVIVGLFMFFQSPERRLANGFANLVTADTIGVNGAIESDGSFGKMNAKIHATTDKKLVDAHVDATLAVGESGKATADMQVIVPEDGMVYAKVSEPKKLMDSLGDSFITSLFTEVPGLVLSEEAKSSFMGPLRQSLKESGERMEDTWIKVTQEQLRRSTGDAEASTDCYIDFARELKSNKKASDQLAGAYHKYSFIVIDDAKVKSEGTSEGYRVSLDQAKLKEFKDSVSDNEAVKKLGSCGLDILTLGASDSLRDQSVDVWVDRLNSNITRVKYDKSDGSDMSSVDLRFTYGGKVEVSQPNDSIGLLDALPSFLIVR